MTQKMDNILKPPDTVGGMTNLNKALFEKDIVVPFITIEKVKLSKVMPLVKRCLLKLENLKPIQHLPGGDVHILLNPQQIKHWASFTERERKDLFDVSVTENDFKEKMLGLKYENYSAEDILRAVLPPDKEGNKSFDSVLTKSVVTFFRDVEFHKDWSYCPRQPTRAFAAFQKCYSCCTL